VASAAVAVVVVVASVASVAAAAAVVVAGCVQASHTRRRTRTQAPPQTKPVKSRALRHDRCAGKFGQSRREQSAHFHPPLRRRLCLRMAKSHAEGRRPPLPRTRSPQCWPSCSIAKPPGQRHEANPTQIGRPALETGLAGAAGVVVTSAGVPGQAGRRPDAVAASGRNATEVNSSHPFELLRRKATKGYRFPVDASAAAVRAHLLLGSDFPMITPDRWLRDFEQLDFDDEVKPLVLKENAARLLGLS
jgi:Amidohydrolase